MGIVKRRPQVAIDLIDCAEYISKENLDTALRFLDAAETAFAFVAKNPEVGALCKFRLAEAERVRFWAIKGFENHLMFYLPLADGIDVIRVIHGARDLKIILTD